MKNRQYRRRSGSLKTPKLGANPSSKTRVNSLSKPSTRTKKNEGLKVYRVPVENLNYFNVESPQIEQQKQQKVLAPKPKIKTKQQKSALIIDLERDTRDEQEKISGGNREGQSLFKRQLTRVYRNHCVVTGDDNECLLQAAHIVPYKGNHTNQIWNGLLLRVDIHTLFDNNKLTIIPKDDIFVVYVAPGVKGSYCKLSGKKIEVPNEINLDNFREVLHYHNNRCRSNSWY